MTLISHLIVLMLAAIAALFPVPSANYYAKPLPHIEQRATVLFAGDMMFDRTIRTTIDKKGGDFIFSCVDDILRDNDLVVANLEGPITATSSRSVGTTPGGEFNYTFTFPESTAALLYAHNIHIVNLGNNHIYNFGAAGIRSTVSALKNAKVDYFGDPLSARVATETINGVALTFINYNEFVNHGEASTTIAQIQNARAAGQIPVVYAHWGIEYATTSPPYSRELAHRFIDAGAEIVIGSHPHVVEEHEVYGSTALTAGNGKHIYYSLGNFIFDQYWNDGVRHGLLLQTVFTSAGLQSAQEIPVELGHDRRTCPVE